MFLSKSDYMNALGCQKSLWLKKHRKDLIPKVSEEEQTIFDAGSMIETFAHQFFKNGKKVAVEAWEVERGAEVSFCMSKDNDVVFEAFAKTQTGEFCRIDVLRKNGDGFDLIEIKSSTSVKPEHIDDLSFQHYVFFRAGYNIKRCFIMHLNNKYKRLGDVDINELFCLSDVSDVVFNKYVEVSSLVPMFWNAQEMKKEPSMTLHKDCLKCQFFDYCGKELPQYSVFNVFNKPKVDEIYKKRQTAVIKEDLLKYCTKTKEIEVLGFLNNQEYINKKEISNFLSNLEYPLFYLDYESINPPIPLFDNSKPYEQIVFQFSLHIQEKKGGKLKHIGFLHKEKTDPRKKFAQALVNACGKKGSVIVYNQSFEKSRNVALADLFDELGHDLLAINERVVDLMEPFQKRYLYSAKQKGSASIKYVLPAFSEMSYSGMEVCNGSEAKDRYLAFVDGKLTNEQELMLFRGLESYCCQDTLAMAKLVDVLYDRA